MKINNIIKDQYPNLLAATGVAGFITAVVMAAKAAPKAKDILEEIEEDAPLLDKARAVAPVYAPTAGMILISTACIVASNRAHRHRYASLLAIYSIGERTLQKWQTSVLEEVGEKKFEKVRERVVSPDDNPVPTAILLDEDRVVFFDVFSGRYFRMNSVESVRRIINDMNDQLLAGDWISLNDLYFELGLERTEYGDELGWAAYHGTIQADFDSFLKNDRPCVSVSFIVKPRKEY